MATDLTRRIKALERVLVPFEERMRRDPRWRDPAFRENVRRDREALRQEMRNTREWNAAWLEVADIFLDESADRAEAAGDHERAAALRDPNYPGRHHPYVPPAAELDDESNEQLRAVKAWAEAIVFDENGAILSLPPWRLES